MQIIDLDKDPKLEYFIKSNEGQIFAGHFVSIVGTNYIRTKTGDSAEREYRTKEEIINAFKEGYLRCIWINKSDSKKNDTFSIKIDKKDVKSKFLEIYKEELGANNLFVVCDDAYFISNNIDTDYKPFFPIDNIEQLDGDFKMWKCKGSVNEL